MLVHLAVLALDDARDGDDVPTAIRRQTARLVETDEELRAALSIAAKNALSTSSGGAAGRCAVGYIDEDVLLEMRAANLKREFPTPPPPTAAPIRCLAVGSHDFAVLCEYVLGDGPPLVVPFDPHYPPSLWALRHTVASAFAAAKESLPASFEMKFVLRYAAPPPPAECDPRSVSASSFSFAPSADGEGGRWGEPESRMVSPPRRRVVEAATAEEGASSAAVGDPFTLRPGPATVVTVDSDAAVLLLAEEVLLTKGADPWADAADQRRVILELV